jgi:toxin ParE1/3/4
MRLVLVPEAYREIDETIAYYEEQRPGLGVEFYLEVEATVELAAENPGVGSLVSGTDDRLSLRRYLVRRFPFVIWVAEDRSERRVVAVAHASRRPGYWRDRLE